MQTIKIEDLYYLCIIPQKSNHGSLTHLTFKWRRFPRQHLSQSEQIIKFQSGIKALTVVWYSAILWNVSVTWDCTHRLRGLWTLWFSLRGTVHTGFVLHTQASVNTNFGCNTHLGPEVKVILASFLCKSFGRITDLQSDVKIVMKWSVVFEIWIF